ncbi:hypothetical protein Q2463_25185, partial [Escherichia coli]|nr:hypothetical protein [Escherichia coli]
PRPLKCRPSGSTNRARPQPPPKPPPQVFTLPTAPAQRYRQWCELAERQRSGLPIEPDAAQWFEVYPKSKAFAAQQRQA